MLRPTAQEIYQLLSNQTSKVGAKIRTCSFWKTFPCSFSVLPSKSGFFVIAPWFRGKHRCKVPCFWTYPKWAISKFLLTHWHDADSFFYEKSLCQMLVLTHFQWQKFDGCPGVSQTLLGSFFGIDPSPSLLRTAILGLVKPPSLRDFTQEAPP